MLLPVCKKHIPITPIPTPVTPPTQIINVIKSNDIANYYIIGSNNNNYTECAFVDHIKTSGLLSNVSLNLTYTLQSISPDIYSAMVYYTIGKYKSKNYKIPSSSNFTHLTLNETPNVPVKHGDICTLYFKIVSDSNSNINNAGMNIRQLYTDLDSKNYHTNIGLTITSM